jgi:hypothetical protein
MAEHPQRHLGRGRHRSDAFAITCAKSPGVIVLMNDDLTRARAPSRKPAGVHVAVGRGTATNLISKRAPLIWTFAAKRIPRYCCNHTPTNGRPHLFLQPRLPTKDYILLPSPFGFKTLHLHLSRRNSLSPRSVVQPPQKKKHRYIPPNFRLRPILELALAM